MVRSIIAILGFQNVRLRSVNSGVLEANFSRLITLDDVLLLPFQGWRLWNFITRLLDECNRVVSAIDIEISTLKSKCLQFLHGIVVGCSGEREGLVVVSGPDASQSKTRGTSFRKLTLSDSTRLSVPTSSKNLMSTALPSLNQAGSVPS